MNIPFVSDVVSRIFGTIDEVVVDKDKANELKAKIEGQLIGLTSQLMEAREKIILAETKSESFLTSNWRPITILIFVAMVVLDWYGIAPASVPADVKKDIFSLIKVSVSGYIGVRGIEKVAKSLK